MRYVIYLVGTLILSLGITLNTKTQLGVSAIISAPYSISQISGVSLSIVLFLFYVFCVIMQWIILRSNFKIHQWFQLIVSVIASFIVGIFDNIIPVVTAGMPIKLLVLAIAIFCTGFGSVLSVTMDLVPNPADGFADAIGEFLKKDFGFGKNTLDFLCLSFSAILGMVCVGRLVGIYIGTVCAMLFTGRVIAVCQKPVIRWYRAYYEKR